MYLFKTRRQRSQSQGVPPRWVHCDDAIPFREPHLAIECSFVAVTGLSAPGKIGDRIPGLRDGLEIGEAIAPTIALRMHI